MSQEIENFQQKANNAFLLIFTLEMILKIFGLGFCEYINDGFNFLDSVTVIFGILEIFASDDGQGSLSVLRGFRILRILKLFKKAEGLQTLIKTILKASGDAANLGLLIILFVCINALIGKQLFTFEIKDEDGNPSDLNFEDF